MAWGRLDHPQVVDRPQPRDVPPVADAAAPDPAAVQMQIANNLKQVGLAMHNHPKADGRFPAPAIQGPDGKPLLSWRVAILPYLEENELYLSFKLDEPWDSPHNKPLLERMPYLYASVPRPPGQRAGDPHALPALRRRGNPVRRRSWTSPGRFL